MEYVTRWKRWCVAVICPIALSACDKITDSSRAVQEVSRHAFEDTKSSWRDFFMYHPPVPDSLPQTRYCYQMQSDLVCYDGEQRQLTSKLVGYQDGENISWVQPGGGSLGASGGEPVALRPIPVRESRVSNVQHYAQEESTIDTGPVADTKTQSSQKGLFSGTNWGTSSSTVPKTSGEIGVKDLPKDVAKKTGS